MNRASKWFYGIALCILAVSVLGYCTETSECTAKGGERMRTNIRLYTKDKGRMARTNANSCGLMRTNKLVGVAGLLFPLKIPKAGKVAPKTYPFLSSDFPKSLSFSHIPKSRMPTKAKHATNPSKP